jgi:putative ABC transport system permease protein
VDAVLLRRLPFAAPERLVFIWNESPHLDHEPLAPARALDIRRDLRALDKAALIGHISMSVLGAGPAERWYGDSVSSSFFDVVGAEPQAGRTFHQDDARDVVVLSHRLWMDKFGGDPAAIGRTVTMNGRPRLVVGVMRPDFFWPSITGTVSAENPPLFWTCADATEVPERPLNFDEDITKNRSSGYLRLVGRLRADVSTTSARAEADALAKRLAAEYPQTDGGRGLSIVSARDQLLGPVTRPLQLVYLGSLLVVIGACVTVANLLLVRQAGRRREFAVRAALGAGRLRLAVQLMIESMSLTVIAGAAGLVLAAFSLRAIVAVSPASVGRLDHAGIGVSEILATLAVTCLAGLALGLASATAFWRTRGADDLRGAGTAERSGSRGRQLLLAVQVGVAMTLMIGAVLFGESLRRLQHVDVGFNTDRLLTFDVNLTGERAEYQAKQLDFFDRLIDEIRAMPGVQAAAGAVTLPVGGDDWGSGVFVEGRPLPAPGSERRIGFQIVGSGWFDTLGMRLVSGRDFTSTDTRSSERVVVINRTLADLEWPGQSPIGAHIKYAREADAPVMTVIGVVSDIRHMGPSSQPRPELYLSYHQSSLPMMAVAVRAIGDPVALMPGIRAAAARIDATQPLSTPITMTEHLNRAYGNARFLSTVTVGFGILALVLAVVGVYGVTSFGVAERTREFGVRTALGAKPGQLSADVLRRASIPIVGGLAAGTAAAVAAGNLIRSLLFGTTPVDSTAYALAGLALVTTAFVASWLPARRAAAIDPVKALRDS